LGGFYREAAISNENYQDKMTEIMNGKGLNSIPMLRQWLQPGNTN